MAIQDNQHGDIGNQKSSEQKMQHIPMLNPLHNPSNKNKQIKDKGASFGKGVYFLFGNS